jgi:hypothetical protein
LASSVSGAMAKRKWSNFIVRVALSNPQLAGFRLSKGIWMKARGNLFKLYGMTSHRFRDRRLNEWDTPLRNPLPSSNVL